MKNTLLNEFSFFLNSKINVQTSFLLLTETLPWFENTEKYSLQINMLSFPRMKGNKVTLNIQHCSQFGA